MQETEQSVGEPLQELLEGRVRSVEFSGGQVIVDAPRRGRVYLPGSFNPVHEGHKCVSPHAEYHFFGHCYLILDVVFISEALITSTAIVLCQFNWPSQEDFCIMAL